MTTQRPRPGDWVCAEHGTVTPDTSGPVPACGRCGRMLLEAVPVRGETYVVMREPAPVHCDGPDRHRLGPGQVLLGWDPCTCGDGAPPHRAGHRTWSCRRCPSRIVAGLTG